MTARPPTELRFREPGHAVMSARTCSCGSGLVRRALYDARGIFVAYVCAGCEASIRAEYRQDIFTDPLYPIDACESGDQEEGRMRSPYVIRLPGLPVL